MKHFTLLFFCLTAFCLHAQDPFSKDNFAPCGTVSHIDPWLKKYLASPSDYPEGTDTLWVGMQLHLLAKSDGKERISTEQLLDALNRLNTDFAPSGIRFYCKNDWKQINNTTWYQHDSLTQGIQMMFANNVPDVLNAYFVAKAAGNCGYNLPYAGVAMAHGCAGADSHTWTHEVGHALSIQHPFIGWEGKLYNPANPTPDTLTYDYTHFHSKPDTIVPAPLDTALVEYVNGSNCGIAADRICDSGPDYLSYRWNCNGQGQSTVVQKDPSGATFVSDGTLFMSYANDVCQTRFTAQQTAIMRAKLQTDKVAWLAPSTPAPIIAAGTAVQLVSPVNFAQVPVAGALLTWTAVSGATHYLVQVSKVASFGISDFEAVVTDTFALTGNLTVNWNYYWRVRPFNCASSGVFSSAGRFTPKTVSVQSATEAGWRIYPSIVGGGEPILLEIPENWQGQSADFRVFDTAGRLMWQSVQALESPRQLLRMPTESWPRGVYNLLCTGKVGVVRQTVVISN
ncbi:MAG: hypothetical protein ABMA02_01920 [Saprospiraceae bacterium]